MLTTCAQRCLNMSTVGERAVAWLKIVSDENSNGFTA